MVKHIRKAIPFNSSVCVCIFFCHWSSPLSLDYEFTVHIFLQFTKRTQCSPSVAAFLRCTFQVCKTRFGFFSSAASQNSQKFRLFFSHFNKFVRFLASFQGIKSEKKFKTKWFQLFEITRICINSGFKHLFSHWKLCRQGKKQSTLGNVFCSFNTVCKVYWILFNYTGASFGNHSNHFVHIHTAYLSTDYSFRIECEK